MKKAGPDSSPPLVDRIRRGDIFQLGCPSREVMKHVTSSWGVLILIALQDGTLRFSALRRRVTGVSERMLSQTLQWLEQDGLIVRRSYPVVPPHTDYTLTPLGQEAAAKVAALADWIEERLPGLRAKSEQAIQPGSGDRERERHKPPPPVR